ncbi:Acetyltransferase (GNAT) family protein [Nocardiopsis flavescens]|uniref:Acetyltransferase (GNAT) family protein n=1 Tax=Nocardiopsis flavescens TaxID=758803 RepID=A0A1M6GJ74_9ACTN|nr:GNAT family N-acetyltransferase [Nocardiopsis flavescens]SHJ09972.1 Acetyltransferase (GNAT) family protein [Nocardiopsis flavescens]
MGIEIRDFRDGDREAVLELSLLAWEPVHDSLRRVLGARIYDRMIPDWRMSQHAEVGGALDDADTTVRVAVRNGEVAGFYAVVVRPKDDSGEVTLLAVHPAHQRVGAGEALARHAVDWIRAQGMGMAVIETGGDEAHAGARRTYEKAGLTPLPVVRYFQDL